MTWDRLVLSGVVALGLAGCGTGPSLAQQPDAEERGLLRLQKPDADPSRPAVEHSLLDLTPERPAEAAAGRVAANIRATVNYVPILDEEIRAASYQSLLDVRGLPEPERTARQVQVFNDALDKLVERELILQDAYTRLSKGPGQKFLDKMKEAANKEFDKQVNRMKEGTKAKSDDELKGLLRAQGLSLDDMRRQYERGFTAMQYMRGRLDPVMDRDSGHEQILEYYQQHPEEFQVFDSVTWQDIFVDASKYPSREAARQFAELLVRKVIEGEDFVRLSDQYDNGDSRYRKGEGYGHRRGEIRPPEAEAILFKLREGQVGPIVEIGTGYHVIRLLKREVAGTKPFDEKAQNRIRDKLREEVFTREYKKFVDDLKRKANIEYARTAP